MNSYELSRKWFDWCFENPEKIKPNHTALYFFAVEHCNRLGWKEKYGMPTTMAMEAIGIRSYNTYINTLNDLVSWGFITMVQRSKNQYSSNIVALSNFNKALDKALDKALIKHTSKQSESTGESIDSIDKQETSKPINKKQYLEDESINQVFTEFIEHRKQLKKPMTKIAISRMISKLNKYDPRTAEQMLVQSMENGWSGIFEPKDKDNGKRTRAEEALANIASGANKELDKIEGLGSF